jgi:tripartite motif-containing protein 71
MGLRMSRIRNGKASGWRWLLIPTLLSLALGSLAGCEAQQGNNIASPLANPKPTGTPPHPYLLQWGGYGNGSGHFNHAVGIAVNAAGTTLYVADQNNNRIQAFSPTGGYLTQWPATLPSGVAVDGSGNVYVTTQEYIQEFDLNGNLLASGGGPGTELGEFTGPEGLAVESSGGVTTVYVADTGNDKVQAANFLPGAPPPSYGITQVNSWGGLGSGAGKLNGPGGVAFNTSGTGFYVADSGNSLVQFFNLSTGYASQWGGLGPNFGQFNNPMGLATDSSGNVYVADTGNNRVEEFGPGGAYEFQWGGKGNGGGFFNSPSALAVDGAGYAYVMDTGDNLVQKFGP